VQRQASGGQARALRPGQHDVRRGGLRGATRPAAEGEVRGRTSRWKVTRPTNSEISARCAASCDTVSVKEAGLAAVEAAMAGTIKEASCSMCAPWISSQIIHHSPRLCTCQSCGGTSHAQTGRTRQSYSERLQGEQRQRKGQRGNGAASHARRPLQATALCRALPAGTHFVRVEGLQRAVRAVKVSSEQGIAMRQHIGELADEGCGPRAGRGCARCGCRRPAG